MADAAHAAPAEAPGTDAAIDFPHIVMQQDIGRSRRINAKACADNATASQMGLQDFAFKELIQEICDGGCVESQRIGHLARAHIMEPLQQIQ